MIVTTIATRRARAAGAIVEPDAPSNKSDLAGLSMDRAHVICTHGDIGDPKFRLWLFQTLKPRTKSIVMEIYDT